MSIYTPDLTGLDWSYYVNSYQRTIFRYPQKIPFDIPIFENDRLTITRLGTTNSPLVKGVDYVINEDDIDYDAMSVCKNIDTNFSGILLKSITVLFFPTINSNFKIQVTFNQLFADDINYAAINREQEIEVTPRLVANLVARVEYLQQMAVNSSVTYSDQSNITKVALEEYPNGDNDDNLITDEFHDLDTLNGKSFIRPIYGSFFKDSVIVKNSLTNEEFTDGLEIQDLDISRTKTTSNESGVYRLIKVTKSFVGQVKVTYRAYGGIADVASIRSIQSQLNIIESFLSNTSYITPSTLSADPTIILILNKLQELDGTMRLLLKNGLPNYGDVTTGTAVLKKMTAQDTNLHWWTIATLYRVDGSVDNILADVFKFRLKSLVSNLMFECSAAVNVSGNTEKRFSVTCNNSHVPENVLDKYCPKLRILEVNNSGVYSGVVLQFGMKLGAGILQETIDVEDMSGRESCWKLVAFNGESVPAEDTGVLMPNGLSVFTTDEATSLADEATIPFKDGLNIMNSASNIPLQLGSISGGTIQTTLNSDLIFQNLDDIDLDIVKFFEIAAIVDIGETSSFPVRFLIPAIGKNDAAKFWSGCVKSLNLGFAQYDVNFVLFYNTADSNYTVQFDIATTEQSKTLNVTSIVLRF